MATGVAGNLVQNQVAFMILDGVVPLIAAALITVQHPGVAFGSAWGPTSPLRVRKRRTVPAPLGPEQRPEGYQTHQLYNPSIREQISPTSQRHLRHHSNPPEVPTGSPGLPSNPKPVHKNTSPMPSPTGTAVTAGTVETIETRRSLRPEQKSGAPRQLVEKDNLW